MPKRLNSHCPFSGTPIRLCAAARSLFYGTCPARPSRRMIRQNGNTGGRRTKPHSRRTRQPSNAESLPKRRNSTSLYTRAISCGEVREWGLKRGASRVNLSPLRFAQSVKAILVSLGRVVNSTKVSRSSKLPKARASRKAKACDGSQELQHVQRMPRLPNKTQQP